MVQCVYSLLWGLGAPPTPGPGPPGPPPPGPGPPGPGPPDLVARSQSCRPNYPYIYSS